ncbi:MAG: alpha/beta hydrolase [Candidatus Omnitrophota bacterium]
MPKAELKDITLYYEVHGSGYPLLLIAGLGSDHSSWFGLTQALAEHYQVIVFDNRGSGRSDSPDRQCSVLEMARDAVGLLNYLKITSCHILGHSMGGYIAQELAIHYPSLVDKLILESTAAVSSIRNNRLFEDFLKQRRRQEDSQAWIIRWVFWLFADKRFADKTFIDTFIKNASHYRYAQSPDDFSRQIGAVAAFDTRDRTGRIRARTLVIQGQRDILVLPEEARSLAGTIGTCHYESVEDAGHCIHLEDPKGFAASVLKFLKP